jgi:hypothetical protein
MMDRILLALGGLLIVLIVTIVITEEVPESPEPTPTVTVTVTATPSPEPSTEATQTNWEILWSWSTTKGHNNACSAYKETPNEFYKANIENDLGIPTWGQTREEYHKFFKSKCS